MTRLDDTCAILADLVAFPTVSSDSNLEMIVHIAALLGDLGARVDLFHDATGHKANLFATLGPRNTDGGIVLSGHTDVVPVADQDWSTDPFTLHEACGRLYGRGTCDMKGFIAACLAMAPVYAGLDLKRPLHFAFTHDEEVGCLGGQALVAELAARDLRPGIAIVGEPTEMRIVEAHKGCCEYTVEFHGREGHGSNPPAGVNAAEAAVRYAARLLALADELKARAPEDSPFEPPWTTINLGRISGGHVHNVIPGRAEIAWEMRPVQADDIAHAKAAMACEVASLLPAMRAVAPEADIRTHVVGEVVGLEPMPHSAARALLAGLTGQSRAEAVPFSTEAGLFQSLGCAAAVCGPGSIAQAHKPDEYVSRKQLAQCLAMLEGLAGVLTA
ncbi:acetylornithine deacetylase [Rhodovulum sulfidophilum]|uniref:Acetylornithine deacetylase n=1 Tax=Rhodovulum visakhapatnamense TaxID=364297 RepID=A0ABS1RD02_9RHOB|nr:acetylornithine deacetylase [Rhodovulum visakhapatnamense]MBL3568340.1 acetylornithine deacetylase [Rhodovulum visakhapatnamense]MBL3577049.1 acetylornithine deacetylase [Rhodovulum visakhapatnamense]OLS45390.1 acetylornithine deacetylase [Rhodovulum sulfidophilum]